jgi:hypothetical protein
MSVPLAVERVIEERDELRKLGDALARALGHRYDCRKLAFECTCGAGASQDKALEDWQRMRGVK